MGEIRQIGKKTEAAKWPFARGSVVWLNSDDDERTGMTVAGFENGEILCRWRDQSDVMWLEWIHPDELTEGQEIVFTPDESAEEA
jgi:hypothetical protein